MNLTFIPDTIATAEAPKRLRMKELSFRIR